MEFDQANSEHVGENEKLTSIQKLWRSWERENNEKIRKMYGELKKALQDLPIKNDKMEELEVIIITHFLGTDSEDHVYYYCEKIVIP